RKVVVAETLRIPERLCRRLLGVPHPFVVEAPESFVLAVIKLAQLDRTAQEYAELVPAQRVGRQLAGARRELKVQEVVLGGELVVAEELVDSPVEVVGSALHGNLHNRAGALPELGRVRAGRDFEFLDGVNRGGEGHHVILRPRDIHAVQGYLHADGALAVGVHRHHASGNLAALPVYSRALISERDSRLLYQLESRRFHRHAVVADLDQRERIIPGGRGCRDPALTRRHAQQGHLGAGDYG